MIQKEDADEDNDYDGHNDLLGAIDFETKQLFDELCGEKEKLTTADTIDAAEEKLGNLHDEGSNQKSDEMFVPLPSVPS